MAVGNAIVQTAKFKPLSYKEWAAPLEEISTQHAATEAALETLESDADKYERYIRRNPNSEAAIQYKNFISQIENEIEALNQYGMTPERRDALLNLRRSYNKQVKPVKAAVETLDDIDKQYLKDSRKGIIGAPDIDIEYLLEHPEYTVADYKKSYTLGEDILKYSSNLFKGLTGYDNTPRAEVSPDGKFAYISTPQGYTTQDYITALTGEGKGNVTPELKNAIQTARDYFNYDNLNEADQRQVDQILLSAGSKYTKEARTSVRNAPKGHKIDSSGNVVSLTKGYSPIATVNRGTIYKKNSQYYMLDAEGNPTIPVSDFQLQGQDGRTIQYKQKAGAQPGTCIATTSTNIPMSIYQQAMNVAEQITSSNNSNTNTQNSTPTQQVPATVATEADNTFVN